MTEEAVLASESCTEGETDEETQEHVEGSMEQAKKKKKRKKKKKSSADGSAEHAAEGEQPHVDKAEADRRFSKALDSVRQNEDMWVLLAAANIHDAKARKLSEALKSNDSITSINLSGNHIGDDGIGALVAALEAGAASELISLDLRGNVLSEEAEAQLLGLQKRRKQLKIDLGPLQQEQPDGSDGGASGSGRGGAANGDAAAAEGAGPSPGEPDFRMGPMFRRFFQSGGEGGEVEEEAGAVEEVEEAGEELPEPAELWGQVDALLGEGQEAIPQLGDLLRVLCACLEREMPSLPMEQDAPASDMKPHTQALLSRLDTLDSTLRLVPRQVVLQDKNGEPQPALGTHRLWAAEAVALLLLPSHATIDAAVADALLLPQLVSLALALDKANALHCRVLRMLQCGLHSSVPRLWSCLLTPDPGVRLPPDCRDGWQPLPAALMAVGEVAKGQLVGQRDARVGFAIEAAQVLLLACDQGSPEFYNQQLRDQLQADEEWRGAAEPGGALHALLQEQDGDLCGPRPARVEAADSDSGELAGLPAGMITGGQLLSLLKGAGLGAMMS